MTNKTTMNETTSLVRGLNTELRAAIKAVTPISYVVTEEEDQLLRSMAAFYADRPVSIHVFYPTLGMFPISQLLAEWQKPTGSVQKNADIHVALTQMYTGELENNSKVLPVYVILDPERWFKDPQVVRRVLNLTHQSMGSASRAKTLVFVSNQLLIPQKLQRMIEVIYDRGVSDQDIVQTLDGWSKNVGMPLDIDGDTVKAFRGLTLFESRSVVSRAISKVPKAELSNMTHLDLSEISEFKRQQLNKTNLIEYVLPDTNFEQVGGVELFKAWAKSTAASWTDKGQQFGLRPPKGVLLVGAWGCGKSISVKALASEWKLPMVMLSMGKIRSSGVGETEANMRQVLSLVESVAPCILWLDEAEKEMAGGHSSSHSDAGTTSRVIGIFSTWMQETKAPVCLAMTANGVDTLPVELINRANERFFFNLPSKDERIEVLKIHLRKQNQDPAKFNLAKLSDSADQLVGREIEQAIEAAMIESYNAGCSALDEGILDRNLVKKPRIYTTMQEEMNKIINWVGHDPVQNDGIRARYASPREAAPLKVRQGGR